MRNDTMLVLLDLRTTMLDIHVHTLLVIGWQGREMGIGVWDGWGLAAETTRVMIS
jgi:hypothetical protein